MANVIEHVLDGSNEDAVKRIEQFIKDNTPVESIDKKN